MKITRKMLCILLAVIMIVPGISVCAVDMEIAPEESDVFKKLVAFDIMEEEDEILYEGIITRASFVKYIVRCMDSLYPLSSGEKIENIFTDVDEHTIGSAEIVSALEMGILSGAQLFYPDRDITFTDAITIIVNALNYRVYAEANGGYPTGYLYIANSTGILKGVQTDEFVYGATAIKLLYNALFVDYMALSGIVDDGSLVYDITSVKTMREKLNITEYDVILVNNGLICADSMGGEFENKVVVRDTSTHNEYVFSYTNDDILNLFGYRLKIYVRKNPVTDVNEIVYYSVHNSVEETIVYSEDVISSVSGSVEYEKNPESSKIEKVNYNPEEALVYINGVKKADYQFADLKPGNGFTRFIDNNGDNRADYILVYNFSYNVKTILYFADLTLCIILSFPQKA